MVAPAPIGRPGAARIRVMIVDDSAVVRGLTKRWLETESDIEIAGVCTDGLRAVSEVATIKPDVIILDVEMPRMDGLTALPQLHRLAPNARIIMASTLTREGAATTLRAMNLGAADYIAKPEASSLGGAADYQRDLVMKIRALGGAAQAAKNPAARRTNRIMRPAAPVQRVGTFKPRVLVVASSTGGPQALQSFLPPVAKAISNPILIVQHMPPTFTTILAEKLSTLCGKPCVEPKNGDAVKNDMLYLAPGDFHMRIVKGASGGERLQLDKSAPVNFCRPAADPLFSSAVKMYAGSILGVVLTGMGSDGKNGAGDIRKAGGRVIVQDEASSVVWGMPGAVAEAGFADEIKTIPELSAMAVKLMNGEGK